ncbi:helix-turn-helix domain-containing protein [Methylocystis sp. SB2]|uniref:helix-turn-helix domain-containing protein n=1 Tax=Methylocystis sp. (strain SB2) TaxID=743836 RepID=UPI001EFB76B3|nr:helix-turn-helix transcriptional regulator [Methylocystis sp. SB2]ULO25172.1 helix-turn-helix domain-containing protein [Methylocystis sp. SB2]
MGVNHISRTRNDRRLSRRQSGADDHLLKAQLVRKIEALLKERGLKQVQAAKLFGVKQPDVSKLLHGDFRQFSLERLMRFLVALGQDVEIVVKPHHETAKSATLSIA